jgi:hypothetical protein
VDRLLEESGVVERFGIVIASSARPIDVGVMGRSDADECRDDRVHEVDIARVPEDGEGGCEDEENEEKDGYEDPCDLYALQMEFERLEVALRTPNQPVDLS